MEFDFEVSPELKSLVEENAKLREQLKSMTYEMNHYKQMCKQLQSKDEEE